eukprot:scaffold4860_cov160-Pinguiococcus_pyrenoidosus.AAC.1
MDLFGSFWKVVWIFLEGGKGRDTRCMIHRKSVAPDQFWQNEEHFRRKGDSGAAGVTDLQNRTETEADGHCIHLSHMRSSASRVPQRRFRALFNLPRYSRCVRQDDVVKEEPRDDHEENGHLTVLE